MDPRVPRPRASVLPRSGGDRRSQHGDGGDRGERPSGRFSRTNTDREALDLREKGQTYAAVARHLGLKRATDARNAFLRAMRNCPEADRAEIVVRENRRLDELETRIRTRDSGEPEKLERRLAALAHLREGLD